MYTKLSPLALLLLSGSALAQPATFTDLGTHTTSQSFTQNVTLTGPTDIQWFRIVLPAVTPVSGWVDIWTTPTANPVPASDMTDTEIGLYDEFGVGAGVTYNDDDDGPGLYSALSYGSTTSRGVTTYPGQGNGVARNGRDGPLLGGTYYLAVGRFNVTFAPAFVVTSTYAGTQTTALLNFDIGDPNAPVPPSATGAVDQASAAAGSTVTYTVTVTPGANPPSTGIAVTGNLTSLGGGASMAFNDNGTGGDATAGDNVFTLQYALPAGLGDQSYSIPVSVSDAQSRTASTSISGSVLGAVSFDEASVTGGDAGQDIAGAATPSGTGTALNVITGSFAANDVDIYRINICDEANFSVTTRFTSPSIDTQLFIFDPNGMGVVFNDDVPTGMPGDDTTASTITSSLVNANGDYYLAISRYDIDPVDASSNPLWIDTPFDTERAPDGAGAAAPFASWTGTNAATGNYRISFTGTCFPGGTPAQCSPADVGMAGGIAGHDRRLDNNDFIAFITLFFNQDPQADLGTAGGVPGHDNAWDNNDFIAFINYFFNDQGQCTG